MKNILVTKKPPIAYHSVWSSIVGRFNLQPRSLNQRRFPLKGGQTPVGVKVTCVCGEQFDPFRDGSMFFTAYGHRSCAATPTARHWALWAKVEIGKLTGVIVQDGLYD
jgi:hypothetical protein